MKLLLLHLDLLRLGLVLELLVALQVRLFLGEVLALGGLALAASAHLLLELLVVLQVVL